MRARPVALSLLALGLLCGAGLALRAAGPSASDDPCSHPPAMGPLFWMRPMIHCDCAVPDLEPEELAARRTAALERAARAKDLEKRIDALSAEQHTYEMAAEACLDEADDCRGSRAWLHPIECLQHGLSPDKQRAQAALHDADARSAKRRKEALEEELTKLAYQSCCDHDYLTP